MTFHLDEKSALRTSDTSLKRWSQAKSLIESIWGLLEVFVGFVEELVDLVVEVVGVFAQRAMARVRNDPEIGVGNVLVYQDSVGNRNKVVVATNDQRRSLDRVKLGDRDVRLLPVEEEELAVVLFLGSGVGPVKAGFVFFPFAVPESGLEGIGCWPEVGPGGGEALHLFRIADSE